MEQVGVQFIANGGDAYITTLNQATKSTNTFVDATEQGGGKVSAAGQIMIGGLRQLGTVAVDAFARAAKATAAFVGDSVNLAGDFESGMLSFQSVAGKDVDTSGLKDFRDLFLDIGKRLPVSTAAVQQAAIEMVKGGIDPAALAAGGLEQNIQFAAAAMEGDLVKAAEISSKIMGGWAGVNATAAEKADFLTHATDMLTKAANASATDVEGLSRGIFNAQGIARTAGVSFDDLTTTLAELAPRFASSSEAGNSLKNMIARLQPTTDPAASAMEGLGLYTEEAGSKFYDATGTFVGFEQASQLLQDSLKGLTKEQQAATLQQIFGNDAMGSAAALAELGAQGYQNMAAALTQANGVADAAALKQQGFNTSLDNAKGSLEALQITIGSALLPILGDLLDNYVAPGVNALTDLASAVFGDARAFDKLSPTMQDVATTIQDLAAGFAAGVQTAQAIAAEIDALSSTFSQASGASDQLAGVVDDLSGVWAHASAVVADVMDGYEKIALAVLPIVTQFVDDHGAAIGAFMQAAYDKIMSIVNLALSLYDAIVPKVLGSVAAFISDHADAIETVLSGAWDVISGVIDAALTLIEGILKIALDVISGDWAQAWTDLQQMSAAIVLDIQKVISGFLDIIAGFFDSSMADIAKTWQDNWDMLVNIATKTDWAQVGEYVVDGILQGLRDSWDSLTHWVTNKVGDLVDSALAAIGAASPAKEWMPVGAYSVQGIMEGFSNLWPSLTDLVSSLGDDLVSQAADIAQNVQGAIADAFGATASVDRQKVANIDALQEISDRQRAGVQSQINAAEEIARGMSDPVQAAKYFKLRSQQLIELGKLQDQINAETDADERARLVARYTLINDAQLAEMKQFQAEAQAQTSPLKALIDQIGQLFNNSRMDDLQKQLAAAKTDAERQRIQQLINAAVVPVNDTGVGADLMALLRQLEISAGLYTPPGTTSPPASSAQLSSPAGSTSTTSSRTYNMPIYTNNSPAALQQSLAVLEASMP